MVFRTLSSSENMTCEIIMNIKAGLAMTLVFYREQSGLSQEELAYRSDLHRTYISQIERELKMPTILSLYKICTALNITLTQFVSTFEENVNVQNK